MNSELFKALTLGGSQGAPGVMSELAPAGPGAAPSPSPVPGSPLFAAMLPGAPLQAGPEVAFAGKRLKPIQIDDAQRQALQDQQEAQRKVLLPKGADRYKR